MQNSSPHTHTDTNPTFAQLLKRFDRQVGDLHAILTALQKALQEQAEDKLTSGQELPFLSLVRPSGQHDYVEQVWDVALWHHDYNACEWRDTDSLDCETTTGVYYGTSDYHSPCFCPRHFFQMHYDPAFHSELVGQPHIIRLTPKEAVTVPSSAIGDWIKLSHDSNGEEGYLKDYEGEYDIAQSGDTITIIPQGGKTQG